MRINFNKFVKHILLFAGYIFRHNTKSKVLYYHDVSTKYTEMGTPLDLIKKQIEAIRRAGFEIVTEIHNPQKQVVLTFDDGWRGLYEHKDFFIKEGIFPIVFIAVDLIGKPGYMNKEEILDMQCLGFRFESHSWSHKGLSSYDDEGLNKELLDARLALEALLKHSVTSICFPQGKFSNLVVEKCYTSGYHNLYSSLCGGYNDLGNKGVICRNLIAESSPRILKYQLLGESRLYRKKLMRNHIAKL